MRAGDWQRRKDRIAVTSVEPGCTCGGVAACPQCQERDAPFAEKDALLRVLNEHAWERSIYADYGSPWSPIGKWGWRCPCGEFVMGETGHREHMADVILEARIIRPGDPDA